MPILNTSDGASAISTYAHVSVTSFAPNHVVARRVGRDSQGSDSDVERWRDQLMPL